MTEIFVYISVHGTWNGEMLKYLKDGEWFLDILWKRTTKIIEVLNFNGVTVYNNILQTVSYNSAIKVQLLETEVAHTEQSAKVLDRNQWSEKLKFGWLLVKRKWGNCYQDLK